MEIKQPADGYVPSHAEEDALHGFMMAGGTIRGAIVDGSLMVNQMRSNHELGILETLVLGQAYLGACLMSAGLKGKDRLSLKVDCSGPIKGFSVEANAAGEVRGFLKNVPIPVDEPLEDFNLSPFFGAGFLSVTRFLTGSKRPFTGQVMMENGTLAKDLAHYYLTSEQIPTSFGLSVQFDRQGRMRAAGGLFLQAMPDADETVIDGLEQRIVTLPSIGGFLAEGNTPRMLIHQYFNGYGPKFMDRRKVAFSCHCDREYIRNVLTMLPLDELKDIQEKGPFPVKIRCHHCNSEYAFDQHQIDLILANRFSD